MIEPCPWDERDKKIKLAVRELHKQFSEACHFKIAVKDWSCDYSFGINYQFDPLYKKEHFAFMHREPYSDHRHFIFEGFFLSPPQYKGKKVNVNLFERDYLNALEREKNLRYYEEEPPTSIGALQKANEGYWAFVSCPEDAVESILQIAAANKVNFISLCTEKMRYGQASILSFSLNDRNGDDEGE